MVYGYFVFCAAEVVTILARFRRGVKSWTFRAIEVIPGQRRPETCDAEFPDGDARWLAAVASRPIACAAAGGLPDEGVPSMEAPSPLAHKLLIHTCRLDRVGDRDRHALHRPAISAGHRNFGFVSVDLGKHLAYQPFAGVGPQSRVEAPSPLAHNLLIHPRRLNRIGDRHRHVLALHRPAISAGHRNF